MSAPISYDLAGAAAATGIHERALRDAVRNGDLVALGAKGSKLLFLREHLEDYIRALPVRQPTT